MVQLSHRNCSKTAFLLMIAALALLPAGTSSDFTLFNDFEIGSRLLGRFAN
jgi:hypothetical protein